MMADELFNQADLNKDQRLDLNEFRNLIAQNLGASASAAIYTGNVLDGGLYGSSAYDTSSSGTYGDISAGGGGIADLAANTIPGRGVNAGYSSYEQASYASSPGGAGAGEFDGNGRSPSHLATNATGASASSSSFETSNGQQVQQYAMAGQGLYHDPNPQIIRRPAQSGQLTYTQNIRIRFLQPPAIPPPGPLIIKEVRPPQPPPPPPLVVRQRAPPLPQPPPLILREKPPPIPAALGAQTVIRKLPALPIPPRSVIIERLPPLPPKPRDIIIERWIPYSALSKRKTIVQRADPPKPYPKPRNIIIQYESPPVRVVRQFQRLGVTPENPQVYAQRYGASLFDAQTLVQQARAAGVIEDISPPANIVTTATSSSSYNADFTNVTSAVDASGAGGGGGGASSSSFESSNFTAQQGASGFSGFESSQSGGGGGSSGNGGFASSYESSVFVPSSGLHGSTYSGYRTSPGGNIDLANTAFNAADINKDGSIDPHEFRQFIGSHPQ